MMCRYQYDMQRKMKNQIRSEMGARGARFHSSLLIPGIMLAGFLFSAFVLDPASADAQDFGRRERSFDVLHYDIRVRLDETEQTVHGDVRITLRGLRASHPPHDAWNGDVVLDAVNM